MRIPIGKVTKLSFQRVLICHVWISYEGVASVLNSELLSVRVGRDPIFPATVCPSSIGVLQLHVFLAIGLAELQLVV